MLNSTDRIVMRCFPAQVCLIAVAVCASSMVQASDPGLETKILLRNGGVLYGEVAELTENKQRIYVVTTSDGTVIKLRKSAVRVIERPSEALKQYYQRRDTVPNTVDGHWKMQEWCLENKLREQREYHLLRVVELDPDHRDARARLGFMELNGNWIHRDHHWQAQGYVRDSRGRFRLPEAIQIKERQDAIDNAATEWNKKIKNWINKIERKNDAAAWQSLQSITDPAAIDALMRIYQKENQTIAMRRALIDVFGNIKSRGAQNALVQIATLSSNISLAELAVNRLKQDHFDPASIAGSVLHWLSPSTESSLDANQSLNRAAWLIGQVEYLPAIPNLINALNTTHKVRIGSAGGNLSTTFGNDGTGGLNTGASPTSTSVNAENEQVLDTLRILTTANFEYSEQAWLDWYIRQTTPGTNSLHRDP